MCVYIQEAHFVERGEDGEIKEGWPIGYYEYEYPKHKVIEDRIHMASVALQEMQCMREAEMVLIDYFPHDAFSQELGAWPDQAFCISSKLDESEGKLLYRGKFVQDIGEEYGGCRQENFADGVESLLNELGQI